MVFLLGFFRKKNDFEKYQQTTKYSESLPACKAFISGYLEHPYCFLSPNWAQNGKDLNFVPDRMNI